MCSGEVEIRDLSLSIFACLLAADETGSDAGLDCLVGCVVESDESAALME